MDFIHQLINEEDAASLVREQVLADQRARYGERIVSVPGISHHDQYAVLFVACDATINLLIGIVGTPMRDRIGQRFAQRRLDFQLFSRCTLHLARHGENSSDDR
jgi:hypothetical protein